MLAYMVYPIKYSLKSKGVTDLRLFFLFFFKEKRRKNSRTNAAGRIFDVPFSQIPSYTRTSVWPLIIWLSRRFARKFYLNPSAILNSNVRSLRNEVRNFKFWLKKNQIFRAKRNVFETILHKIQWCINVLRFEVTFWSFFLTKLE